MKRLISGPTPALVRRCALPLNEVGWSNHRRPRRLAVMGQAEVATRWNLNAIEDAYQRWRNDPQSVDPSWRYFFEGFELGGAHAGLPAADAHCQTGIVRLIDAYRDLGHFLAHLDPLSDQRSSHPLLELSEFGFDEADLDRTFDTSHFVGLPTATLRELLAALRDTY